MPQVIDGKVPFCPMIVECQRISASADDDDCRDRRDIVGVPLDNAEEANAYDAPWPVIGPRKR